MMLIDINTSNLLTLSSDAISHCHTKKTKMSRCQDVKIARLILLSVHRLYSPKMAVGANRNYLPAFNIILGDGNKI